MAAAPAGPLGAIMASTDASFAAAHALRDGQKFLIDNLPIDDEVDLVVVGSGLSGLAAAFFHRKLKPDARILILENHDDFGGHARRAEMRVGDRLILGYGGSESIQSPGSIWSPRALGLLEALGIQLGKFERYFDRDLYPGLGLSRGVLFTKESFGTDKLVTGDPTRTVADDIAPHQLNARSHAAFVEDYPLPKASREKLQALYEDTKDVLAGRSVEEKLKVLTSISYHQFLLQHWGLDEAAANTFAKRPHDYFAIGTDAIAALEAQQTGYPGFAGLGLPKQEKHESDLQEPYIYHFPDGNASITRLIVRQLIPGVAPGHTMEDIVTAPFDYSKLDSPSAKTRLRLGSTVVVVRRQPKGLDLGYMHGGQLRRLRAGAVVYAGYNMMLPYSTEDLEAAQRAALSACVKAPLVYVKVAVRDWRPWVKMGVHEVSNPMGFFSRIKLDYPVSMGGYQFAKSPSEPIGLHLVHVPTPLGTGVDARAAWRVGRAMLLSTPYEQFEAKVFDELTRLLGPGGFDAKRDIAAIHVYRWGHGYSYVFNSLQDRAEDAELNHVARRRIGRLAIANSDAGWEATAECAIDEAARAVDELAELG